MTSKTRVLDCEVEGLYQTFQDAARAEFDELNEGENGPVAMNKDEYIARATSSMLIAHLSLSVSKAADNMNKEIGHIGCIIQNVSEEGLYVKK